VNIMRAGEIKYNPLFSLETLRERPTGSNLVTAKTVTIQCRRFCSDCYEHINKITTNHVTITAVPNA
jgi:hypothetical protein